MKDHVAPLAMLLTLGGCALLPPSSQETLGYYLKRDWTRVTSGQSWQQTRKGSGLSQVLPNAVEREEQGEVDLCRHANTRTRRTTQNGINDAVEYRQCPATLDTLPVGERLAPRA